MSDLPYATTMPAPSGARYRNGDPEERLCRLIAVIVATAFGVTVKELRSRSRGPASVALARQVAMYLGHVVFGLNLTRLGHGFGRDRTTARHAVRMVEECRDDPIIDQFFTALELVCSDTVKAWRAEQKVVP